MTLRYPHHSSPTIVLLAALACIALFPCSSVSPAQPPASEPPAAPDPTTRQTDQAAHLEAVLAEAQATLRPVLSNANQLSPEESRQLRHVIEQLTFTSLRDDVIHSPNYGTWLTHLENAIRRLRQQPEPDPDLWLDLHDRFAQWEPVLTEPDAITRPGASDSDQRRARQRHPRHLAAHQSVQARLFIAALEFLPPDQAAEALKATHQQLTELDDPEQLNHWLDCLVSPPSPGAFRGDALAPEIHPKLLQTGRQLIFQLLQNETIPYQRRRFALTRLADARYGSGQSSEAGQLLRHWRRLQPDTAPHDPRIVWRQFNIALHGGADREAAWQLLLELQRLARPNPEPVDPADPVITEADARQAARYLRPATAHYYRLLPLSDLEYQRLITAEEQRYLNSRSSQLPDDSAQP